MSETHQVFISYSHDSVTHEQAVLAFTSRLREDGIDAWLDQYEVAPKEGWPRWMDNQIGNAKFVLLVCTKIYCDRVMSREVKGKGHGAIWEGNLIYQYLHDAGTENSRFIPLLTPDGEIEHIPAPLRGAQRYSPFTERGYTALYRHLTGQPAVEAPPLGTKKLLKPQPLSVPPTSFPSFGQEPEIIAKRKLDLAPVFPHIERPDAPEQRENVKKVGRHDLCPCGSGKKYRRCHGADTSSNVVGR